ncbi:unnamed protein product [Haemonchus placei]|uniref:VOC family protein n=1 Tax=Haemonchus placei TaxID=6290 RepID=A0A0N4WE08_HAEPC|nr:unnamed protein product [Haemonchus placei]
MRDHRISVLGRIDLKCSSKSLEDVYDFYRKREYLKVPSFSVHLKAST